MSPRNCPDCRITLRTTTTAGIEIDLCPSCQGIWFDAGEFDALLGRRLAGQDIEGTVDRAVFVRMEGVGCPSNHGQMLGLPFGPTELEFCRTCRGLWVGAPARAVLESLPAAVPSQAAPQPTSARHGQGTWIVCYKCEAEVERKLAVFEQDAFWCNSCVLKGDYPGARELRNNVQMTNDRVRTETEQAAERQNKAGHNRVQHPVEAFVWNFIDLFQHALFPYWK